MSGLVYTAIAHLPSECGRWPVLTAEFSTPLAVQGEEEEKIAYHCRKLLREQFGSSRRRSGGRNSFTLDQYVFSYLVYDSGELVFVAVADMAAPVELCWNYLANLRKQYRTLTDREPLPDSSTLTRLMQSTMASSEESCGARKVEGVERALEGVATIMRENLHKVMERGEQIECLVDKTNDLQDDAFLFRKSARKVKRHFWWRSVRRNVYTLIFIAAFGLMGLAWIFGWSIPALLTPTSWFN